MSPGETFNRLTATRPTDKRRHRAVVWEFSCKCGNTVFLIASQATGGHTKSCGCQNIDSARETSTTHGMQSTKAWRAWKDMKARCNNPKLKNFPRYGGRGISVCDRWMQSFENFYADMGFCADGLTIERVNNNGNYEPGNCVWATRDEQANNTRRSVYLEFAGKRRTVAQWAKELGVHKSRLLYRIKIGLPSDKVLDPSIRRRTNG